MNELSRIESSLPVEFDFYHLGSVALARGTTELPQASELEELQAIGFAIQGERPASLLVLFDRGLDSSTYSELGNIIASQLATKLSQGDQLCMISPPSELSTHRLKTVVASLPANAVVRTYQHFSSTHTIPVRVVLTLNENGATAHA